MAAGAPPCYYYYWGGRQGGPVGETAEPPVVAAPAAASWAVASYTTPQTRRRRHRSRRLRQNHCHGHRRHRCRRARSVRRFRCPRSLHHHYYRHPLLPSCSTHSPLQTGSSGPGAVTRTGTCSRRRGSGMACTERRRRTIKLARENNGEKHPLRCGGPLTFTLRIRQISQAFRMRVSLPPPPPPPLPVRCCVSIFLLTVPAGGEGAFRFAVVGEDE